MSLVMKKSVLLAILFSSIALISTGLGCFRANAEMKPAKADTYMIEMNGDTVTVGTYPQNIVSIEEGNAVKDTNTPSTLDGDLPMYKYKGELYTPIEHCRPYTGGAIMSTGEYGSAIFNQERWFLWQPITWTKFNTFGNITYFYANLVLDARDWQPNIDGQYISGTTIPANDWVYSEIRTYLNDYFYSIVFSFDESQALSGFTTPASENTSGKDINDKVGIMPKDILSKHSELFNAKGTDFAMAKSMQYNLDGTMTTAYYYLNSNENNPTDNTVVDIATGTDLTQSKEVRVTTTDCKCGIRPFIAIDNSHLKTKKSGGSSSSSTPIKVNVTLIIAIIFSILGMAGVITFLMLWHKGVMITIGHTTGPIWMIVFVCLFAVLCLVGIGMIFGSTLGGIAGKGYKETDVIGYYSSPEFTLDTLDPEFGYSYYYGLAKDHSVYRYYADKWDDNYSVNNPLMVPYPGVGSWELKNNKLIITAASNWRLFDWEEPVTTYKAKDGFGFGLHGALLNEGSQETAGHVVNGYRWYHGSTKNPTGEKILLRDAGWTY